MKRIAKKKRNPEACPKCGGKIIKQPTVSDEYIWLECHNMVDVEDSYDSKYCGWRKAYKV